MRKPLGNLSVKSHVSLGPKIDQMANSCFRLLTAKSCFPFVADETRLIDSPASHT